MRPEREFVVMGNDYERNSSFFIDLLEQIMYGFSGLGVQITGRFIRQHYVRIKHQCSCDGNPLLFAA